MTSRSEHSPARPVTSPTMPATSLSATSGNAPACRSAARVWSPWQPV